MKHFIQVWIMIVRNILRSITSPNQSLYKNFQNEEKPGIYAECIDPRCSICKLGYIKNCTKFETSSGHTWEIRSHINCNSTCVIYYLECLMCNGAVTKTGKTSTKLRSRINNHISECKSGNTSDIFDLHVHKCGKSKNNLNPPYFRVKAYMKLSSPEKLLTYEKLLHSRKYATINT